MKKLSNTLRLGVLLTGLAAATVQAGVVQDQFGTSHDYLTQGVVGTIWEGVYFGAGDIPNIGLGGGPGQTLVCNANTTASGMLTLQTKNTDWEAANNDGFFMYKTVSGDFQAVVKIVTPFNNIAYHCAGLMARAAGPGGAALPSGENYVSWFRFDEFGFANYGRNTINNGSDNVNPGDAQGADLYWLMLERVGTTFNCYQKAAAGDDWVLAGPVLLCSFDRPDLAGLPVQVGLMQATFSPNDPVVQFQNFSLTNINVGAGGAAAATGLTATPTVDGNLSLSWTPGAGSSGSLVVVRRNGAIARQPSFGTVYTGNASFGAGTQLGVDTYAVFAGAGNSVVMTAPAGTYSVAVYSYSGAGASINYNLSAPPTATVTLAPVLQTITLDLPTELILLSSSQAKVNANYSNGSTSDVTASATYSSTDPAVLSVSAGGLVTAVKHGTATITASFSGKSASKAITVSDPTGATIIHRYNFNDAPGLTTAADIVGGKDATIIGGCYYDGTGQLVVGNDNITIPPNNYVDLPNDLLTSLQSVTFEAWVTDLGTATWGRIWDFGASYGGEEISNGGSNYFFMCLPDNGGSLRAAVGYDPGESWFAASRPPVNKKTHIVYTSYAPAHLAVIYVDGKPAAVEPNNYLWGTTTPVTPAALGPMPNMWLGRSQYPDPGFNGTYDEFRIWNGSLSTLQVLINSVVGPDQLVADPGALQSVQIAVESNSMKKNASQQASVKANFANVSNIPITTYPDTTYTSSDSTVVAVDAAGKLTSFGKLGSATITASFGGLSSSAVVTVVPFSPAGYAYNMQISFDGYTQPEALNNFPVLVPLSTSIPGFNYAQFLSPNAAELRFADASGDELNYQIESWNPSGVSHVWVQVPSLVKGAQITAFWGKAGVAPPSYSASTWGPEFLGVWHMETNYVKDASSRGNNATAIVTESAVTTTDGIIGPAQYYEAAVGNGATSVGNLKFTNMTLSAWVWLAEQNREGIFMCKDGNIFFWQQGSNLRHELSPWGGDTFIPVAALGGAAPAQGDWFHIAGTVEGTTEKVYINGQLRGTWTKTPDPMNNNQFQIGGATWGRIMNGKLDECRAENVSRSAAWIWANWKNQSAPSQFMTLSAVYQTTAPLAVVLPTVSLSGNNATLGGRVVSDGGIGVTSYGTVWGTASAPTGNSASVAGNFAAPFSISQERTGFSPAGHYYFRAWASNAVSGKVYSPDGEFFTKPTAASDVVFSAVNNNQFTVSWTASPNAAGYLVVARLGSAVTVQPTDGGVYAASADFGAGQDLGSGQFVVYSGTGTSFTLANLRFNSTYHLAVYAYAGSGATTTYQTPAVGSQTTTVAATSEVPRLVLASAPAAFWPLYDTAGTVETEIVAGRNGNYIGPVTLGNAGPRPGTMALGLDGGSARAKVPYNAALNPPATDPFTVMGWFKPNATMGAGALAAPLSSGHLPIDPNRSGWLVYQSDVGWNLRMYSGIGSGTSLNITGTTKPVAGTWYHVAVTWDGTTGKVIVNGVEEASAAGPGFTANTDGAFTLGARSDDAFAWNGYASEVALFKRALTAAELRWLYLAPRLEIVQAGGLKVTWTEGVLQQSNDVDGPYTDVLGAASPYPVPAGDTKYYRLRSN